MKRKFLPAFHGILDGLHHKSIRIQYILGIMAVIAGIVLRLTAMEWIAVVMCIGFVITTEVLNTCIEKICDFLTLNKNEEIKVIKDLAASAVLLSSITSLTVAIIILISHLKGL